MIVLYIVGQFPDAFFATIAVLVSWHNSYADLILQTYLKRKKNSKWKCRAGIEIVDIIYDFNFLKSILGQIGFFLLFI